MWLLDTCINESMITSDLHNFRFSDINGHIIGFQVTKI